MTFRPIAEYLPHDHPMIFLDQLISCEQDNVVCKVSTNKDGLLAQFLDNNNQLPLWFLVEIIAQTVGVWNGYHKHNINSKPPIALLLSIRKFETYVPFIKENSTLYCKANLVLFDEKLSNFNGEIICDNQIIAKGSIIAYEANDQLI